MTDRMYTFAVNKTALGDYWGDNLWLHAADKVLQSGTEYLIPLTTSASSTPGGTQDDPMSHYYVSGIGFDETDFVIQDVHTIDYLPEASVSQNFPNPFNSSTLINLTLNKKANVSIEVFNLVGQKVMSVSSRSMEAGTHSVSINANGLNAGTYIYTVIANGERVSRKMTVK